MPNNMARLNKELIQAQALKLGKAENASQFAEFMGWSDMPSKAYRVYNATTTKPELDTLEELAFKLNLNPNQLILPSGKRGRKAWPNA